MYDWVELGNRLRLLRLERGFTQERLSRVTEIPVTQLRAFEHGRRMMTVEELVSIALALEISLDYLACGRQEAIASLLPGLWRLRDGLPSAWWRRRVLRLKHPEKLSSQCPRGLKHED